MKNTILSSLIASVLSITIISIFGFDNTKVIVNENEINENLNSELPIGTIIAFGGLRADLKNKGWLRCDGSSYYINEYPKLYNVIKNVWGPVHTNNNSDFTVPNLQGMFLRGAESGLSHVNRKKDKSPRYNIPGAIPSSLSGDIVGTYQKDFFKGHNHGGGHHDHGGKISHSHRFNDVFLNEHRPLNDDYKTTSIRVGDGGSDWDNGYAHYLSNYTDREDIFIKSNRVVNSSGVEMETVPKNAAVHYYIKYK